MNIQLKNLKDFELYFMLMFSEDKEEKIEILNQLTKLAQKRKDEYTYHSKQKGYSQSTYVQIAEEILKANNEIEFIKEELANL